MGWLRSSQPALIQWQQSVLGASEGTGTPYSFPSNCLVVASSVPLWMHPRGLDGIGEWRERRHWPCVGMNLPVCRHRPEVSNWCSYLPQNGFKNHAGRFGLHGQYWLQTCLEIAPACVCGQHLTGRERKILHPLVHSPMATTAGAESI